VKKDTPAEVTFGSIEGAAEYLGLLLESVNEARVDLEAETALASATGAERRQQAIQLASYKLSQLKMHLSTSHRILNDLRTLRRLLFDERQTGQPTTEPGQFTTTAESLAQPVPVVKRKTLDRPSAPPKSSQL
jgi:hypothetical protein